MNKIKQLLRKPFPTEESTAELIKTSALISLFVIFFLYHFQPNDLSDLESNIFLICLGFGLVCFVSIIFYEMVISRLLKLKGKPEHFTFGKWILHMVGLILTISFANFLYSRLLIFGYIKWDVFPHMIYGTFSVGIFPIILLGALALMQQEKKYQAIANEINETPPKNIANNQKTSFTVFNIPSHQIKYIEALQNYVKIGYLDTSGQLTEQTERATIKGILETIEGSSILKCHRSFLVNKEAIVSTSGNAQGLLLTLSDCDKTIPVSRSFVATFRGL